jgi:hypothetical protein
VISRFRHGVDKICALPDVTLRRLVLTDVSGQPNGSILKGQAMQEEGFLLGFLDH